MSVGFRASGDVGALVPGRPAYLSIEVYSAIPLDTVEIWSDGQLAGSLDPAAATAYTTTFGWVPDDLGVHAVSIRAIDRDGGTSTAGPIWTRVFDVGSGEAGNSGAPPAPDPNPLFEINDCLATITPSAGDASVFVAGFGSAFDQVGTGSVQIAVGDSPLLAYTEADGRASVPVLIPSEPGCRNRGWSGDITFNGGILSNPSGADAAYLYVSYDDETWQRVPAENQTFVLPGIDGGFDFGSLLSPPVGAPAAIEVWGWKGSELVALGAGRWEPEAATGSPSDVSLSGLAGPVIADTGLDWILNTGNPVRQGTICTYEPTNPAGTIATFPDTCANAPTGVIPTTFRWASAWGTSGILQVSALPPPAGSALSFPGLLSMQKVPAPTGGSVDFPVDFDAIFDPTLGVATDPDPSQMTYQIVAGLVSGSSGPQRADFSPPWFQTAAGESAGQRRPLPSDVLYLRVIPMDGAQPLPGASNTVVIDLENDAPIPTVHFDVPELTMKVDMVPPTIPNPEFSHCVRVISNPFGDANPTPTETGPWNALHPDAYPSGVLPPEFYQKGAYDSTRGRAFVYENGVEVNKGLIPGATVCAVRVPPPKKGLLETIGDAVTFITKAWDLYSDLYEMIKDKVADALVYVTQCDQALPESTCKSIAKTAVQVGLTAVGAPPSIPKFSALVDAAKGDLATWLVEESKVCADVPVELQQECEDTAADMAGQLFDEIQIAASNAAVAAAGSGSQWSLTLHPGIVVVPEPAGTLAPATFDITFKRSPGATSPDFPASCHLNTIVQGSRENYQWTQYYPTHETVSGPVVGDVMQGKGMDVDLSDLAPGESKRIVVVNDKMANWYLPGQWPNHNGVPWHTDPSSWIFLAANDATISMTVSTTCGLSKTKDFPRNDQFPQPWDIP